jgi:uncharacterized protein DUF4412
MQIARILMLALVAGAAARADFSYTMTRKSSGPQTAPEQATKTYLKGQKLLTDTGSIAILMDFDAQTVTTINKTQKTYTVMPFTQLGQAMQAAGGADVQVDFKETGQHKTINGFDASQAVMTMLMDMPQMGSGGKMQMEMEFWVSSDVPGAQELRAFYQRNMGKFPWSAITGGANPSMAKAMAEMQKKMAGMNGVPVQQTIRMKPAGNSAQTQQMTQGMAQARQRLEAMAAQGGPQGDAAKQALARMGAMSGGGGSLFETTMESSGFSTNSIPDSVFEVPAGFQKNEK